MAGMEAIGSEFVVIPLASGRHISMKNCQAVTFAGYEDGGATDVVFTQSIAGASTATLANITRFVTSDGIGGAMTEQTMTAGATVEPSDATAQDGWYVTILASQLADTYDSVECTPDGGTCIAILHGLNVKRDPDNVGITGITQVS